MKVLTIMVVAFVAVSLLEACAGRRAARQQQQQQIWMQQQQLNQPKGSQCTAPAAGNCPVCNVQCPAGQPALCSPGETAGNACTVQPSCKCGPAAPPT